LKQIKGISSLLKGSSQFWKGTFTNLGNNFCSCTRPVDMIEDNNEISSDENLLKINDKIKSKKIK